MANSSAGGGTIHSVGAGARRIAVGAFSGLLVAAAGLAQPGGFVEPAAGGRFDPGSIVRVAWSLGAAPEFDEMELVLSLDGYRAYLADRAELWERQALIKARFCAGDPGVAASAAGAGATRRWRPAGGEKRARDSFQLRQLVDQVNLDPRRGNGRLFYEVGNRGGKSPGSVAPATLPNYRFAYTHPFVGCFSLRRAKK